AEDHDRHGSLDLAARLPRDRPVSGSRARSPNRPATTAQAGNADSPAPPASATAPAKTTTAQGIRDDDPLTVRCHPSARFMLGSNVRSTFGGGAPRAYL